MAVIHSDDSLFPKHLTDHSKVIVKYYADWCGSCKLFAPKYKRLSGDERFTGITFLEVNAEINPDARKLGSVNNLPSFSIFNDGKLVETQATNKEDAVVELLNKMM